MVSAAAAVADDCLQCYLPPWNWRWGLSVMARTKFQYTPPLSLPFIRLGEHGRVMMHDERHLLCNSWLRLWICPCFRASELSFCLAHVPLLR